jgi:PAS domain S-box-containing protein
MLSIYLLEGEYLHLQAYIGYEQVISTLHISQGVSGRVVRTGKLIFTRDSQQDPDFIQAFDGISQGINAPLREADGTVSGIIVLESIEPILTEQDVAILELVADQISVAVANARLFEALRASEQRYRALIDQAADAILLTNEEWVISDANLHALDLFEDQREILLGQQLRKRIVLEATGVWPPIPGTVFHIRTSSGGVCPVEASFNSLIENEQTHYIIILRDISERLRAEELQRATQRQLIEGQKLESLGVLVGGIAHDYNNLLMAILGNAGLARLEIPDNAEAHTSLAQIEDAARRAVDLTQQMLAYAGKVYLQREPVNLAVIIEGISPLMRSMIDRSISLECQLDPDIPLIQGDSSLIRRVVLSLVTNAAEAIGDQAGVIAISTSAMTLTDEQVNSDAWGNLQPGQYAVLMVRDTGCGMDAAILPKIFDPFFSTKIVGHGLGLSAAQGIMRTHRGLLRVESSINQGSCFTMLLPTSTPGEPSIIGK